MERLIISAGDFEELYIAFYNRPFFLEELTSVNVDLAITLLRRDVGENTKLYVGIKPNLVIDDIPENSCYNITWEK